MPVPRRTLLAAATAAATAAVTAAVTGCNRGGAEPAWMPGGTLPAAAPTTAYNTRAAVTAPYARAVTDILTRHLKPTPDNPKHPGYAGAVVLTMVDNRTTLHTAVGHALRYTAGPKELPAAKRVAMRPDSIFDTASITKVYTAILVLNLVDKGKIQLDAPVSRYLPQFTGTGKGAVTIRMLLTHTGALPVGAKVTGLPDNAARRRAVLTTPLIAGATPGATFRYSSVGLMVLAQLVEKVTGSTLDRALRDVVTTPLGLRDTGP